MVLLKKGPFPHFQYNSIPNNILHNDDNTMAMGRITWSDLRKNLCQTPALGFKLVHLPYYLFFIVLCLSLGQSEAVPASITSFPLDGLITEIIHGVCRNSQFRKSWNTSWMISVRLILLKQADLIERLEEKTYSFSSSLDD